MTKNQKSVRILTGFGDDVSVGTPEEVYDKHGKAIVLLPVTNRSHKRLCPHCGSTHSNICDSGSEQWAWHIPQGRRTPCKVIYHRKRYFCKECRSSYMEDIPWIYGNSHMTMALYNCIRDDLSNYTTKKAL